MKLILRIFLLLSFFIGVESNVYAQSPEDKARQELNRRGLGDEEVRKRLAQKGIDLDNIDVNDPTAVFRVEKELKTVIAELEAEKVKKGTPQNNSNIEDVENISSDQAKELARNSEEISEAIEEGATLEEAVAEELIDAQEEALPDAQVYGQEIFRTQSIKLYRQSEDVKPPDTYVLGVGDKLAIAIWGYSEENLIFEVNKEGYIKPEGMPRIYLKGLRYDKARKLLEDRFSRFYRFRDQEFQVSLNFARTINVNIYGEAYNYGSFNIPAINTAFNALVAAGGPNDIGSVRKIQLLRAGESPQSIDIYKYMSNPIYGQDLYLEENDIIHIPVAEKVVSILGAVIRPFKYELLENENLIAIMEYCGGFKANATLQNIQIKRYENDTEKILDVNFNQLLKLNDDFILKNGDVVIVNTIPEEYKNYAMITGAVDLPGKYSIDKNTKLSDLLSRVNLLDNALTEIVYIKRINPDGKTIRYIPTNLKSALENKSSIDNISLSNMDEIVIYEKSRYIDDASFSIVGSVREPNTFNYEHDKNLKIEDAIFLAGGLKEEATDFAYIKRRNQKNPIQKEYIRVDLTNTDLTDYYIANGDSIFIYSNLDFVESKRISIGGAVKNPADFEYDKSLTIRHLISLAGGLQFSASKKRVDVFRLQFADDKKTSVLAANLELDENNNVIGGEYEIQPFDRIYVRNAPEFEKQRIIYLKGEVKWPGPYALIEENEKVSSIIQRAGGLTEEAFPLGATLFRLEGQTGFVVFDLADALNNPTDYNNVILSRNDQIVIPKKKVLISLEGELKFHELYDHNAAVFTRSDTLYQKKISAPYEEGKNAKYYIDNYGGGIGKNGSKSLVSVQYANGRIAKSSRFLFWYSYPEVLPGSTIRVNSEELAADSILEDEDPTDWGQVFSDSIAQVTAILSLLLLVQRID